MAAFKTSRRSLVHLLTHEQHIVCLDSETYIGLVALAFELTLKGKKVAQITKGYDE